MRGGTAVEDLLDPYKVTRTALAVALSAVLVLCSAPPATAAPPSNDDFGSATPLGLFEPLQQDTTEAGEYDGEPFTPTQGSTCDTGDSKSSNVVKTVWYTVTGTGGEVTINTFGSDFDTVAFVYDPDGNSLPVCLDDTPSLGLSTGRMSFDTEDGGTYLVQVGGVFDSGEESGFLRLVATDGPPSNDNRADAEVLTAGDPLQWGNLGATERSGEDLSCLEGTFERDFGSTVWFRYTAPASGKATFTSTGFDTVMQVYRGSEPAPLACNDDGPNQVGPSRVSIDVTPGDYFIQVGGYSAFQDDFTLSTEFAIDLDDDNDGSNRPADCNDGHPGIRPGAPDPPDNGVDEDCNGSDAVDLDRDKDTFGRPQDCNDGNPGIHPSATDVPDNGVDEDCNGSDAVNLDRDGDGFPRPADCVDDNPRIHPGARDVPGDRIDQDCSGRDARFGSLAFKYDYYIDPKGRVKTLTARVHRGARIVVSCRGRGCPNRRTYRSRGRTLEFKRQFKRELAGGARIEIRATLRGFIGKAARITYHAHRTPTKRELCIPPGKRRPQKSCR